MDTTYSWDSGELRLYHVLYVLQALSGRCAYQICGLCEVKRENIIRLISRFVQCSLMKWKGHIHVRNFSWVQKGNYTS